VSRTRPGIDEPEAAQTLHACAQLLASVADDISEADAADALADTRSALEAIKTAAASSIQTYLSVTLLGWLASLYNIVASRDRERIEKAAQKLDSDFRLEFARRARALKPGEILRVIWLFAPATWSQFLFGQYSLEVKFDVTIEDVKLSCRRKHTPDEIISSDVAKALALAKHDCAVTAGGGEPLTLDESGSGLPFVCYELARLFSLKQSKCGNNVLKSNRGVTFMFMTGVVWSVHYLFCLRTIYRYQKLDADGNPVGDIQHCARRVTDDGGLSGYLKFVPPLVRVEGSGSWFKPPRFPNLRAAFTSLSASVPTPSATQCPANTNLSLTASSLTGILGRQTDLMPEGTFQPAFEAKMRDDYQNSSKTKLERHRLVVDDREAAALDALTESCGAFLCAKASHIGRSRVAVEGQPLRNVVASIVWSRTLGNVGQGYVAHGHAESSEHAFDEAAAEGLVFCDSRDDPADIALVTAELLSTLRREQLSNGCLSKLHDFVNMRNDHRICYADLLTVAMADPRGAAVALHDEALRKQHAVLESYQTPMPPSIAKLSVTAKRRVEWEPQTKWQLHEANLLAQEAFAQAHELLILPDVVSARQAGEAAAEPLPMSEGGHPEHVLRLARATMADPDASPEDRRAADGILRQTDFVDSSEPRAAPPSTTWSLEEETPESMAELEAVVDRATERAGGTKSGLFGERSNYQLPDLPCCEGQDGLLFRAGGGTAASALIDDESLDNSGGSDVGEEKLAASSDEEGESDEQDLMTKLYLAASSDSDAAMDDSSSDSDAAMDDSGSG